MSDAKRLADFLQLLVNELHIDDDEERDMLAQCVASLRAQEGCVVVPRERILILESVLNQARETLFISIKGTPEQLQASLGKLNLVCQKEWDWRAQKIAAGQDADSLGQLMDENRRRVFAERVDLLDKKKAK